MVDLSRHPGSWIRSYKANETELFVDNVIANTLPDAVTTRDIQRESIHDKTTQMLKDTIGKGYIPQHHAKQLRTKSTFSRNSQ